MMSRIYLLVAICFTLMLIPSTLGVPIFWFPFWNPSFTSSTSSSTTSSSTSRSPVNASISIGNRVNTSAVEDLGTVIDGLSITRSKRFVPLFPPNVPGFSLFQNLSGIFTRQKRSPQSAPSSSSNESVIQIGNQIIKLPPGGFSNLSIHIVDGGSYLEQTAPIQIPANDAWVPFIERIRNVFGDLFV